jgi:hypothetical protein
VLLRHNVVLLEQNELVSAPLLGTVHRIRPSDGDGVPDGQQRWWVFFDLAREGGGVVVATVSSSFDGTSWVPVAAVSTRRNSSVVELMAVQAFGPLLRAETKGEGVLPPHRIEVRLASDGPFAVVPG